VKDLDELQAHFITKIRSPATIFISNNYEDRVHNGDFILEVLGMVP
jgi:hypothetical protein